MICICRNPNCRKEYDNQKSRADLTGYCSQKCMKARAKALGWKENGKIATYRSYVTVLTSAKATGDVPKKHSVKWDEKKPQVQPKPETSNELSIEDYLISQLAIHIIIGERKRIRVMDKQDNRKSAEDIDYVAEQAEIHFDNCVLDRIRNAIRNFRRG